MTPEELESMLGQQEGPKLEFKLEYVFDGQGRDRHMDEVAKDILSLANSCGTDPAFLVLGAADEVDATTGSRSARTVRGQSYSLGRFLDIVNSRCTPPVVDATYEEVEYHGSL